MYTVNPGIEDIASEEIEKTIGGTIEYEPMTGHVYGSHRSIVYDSIYRLRSINKAFILLLRIEVGKRLSDLPMLYERLVEGLGDSMIHGYISPNSSFAVVTERIGVHEYTSIDISRIVGDAVRKVVEEKYGVKPRVDLRKPETIIHVFVRDNEFFLGISLTGPYSMHRRGYRIYDHPAALKPTLAYALLTLSGTRDKQIIIDPMCGCGTIAIEASYLHEEATIYCLDINEKYLEYAKRNALAAGVYDRIIFMKTDARKLYEQSLPEADHIVSNPPYGIRYGSPYSIRRLYRGFIESAYKVLKNGGRLTIITTEYSYARKTALEKGFKKIHERIVQHGGLYPHILVLEK